MAGGGSDWYWEAHCHQTGKRQVGRSCLSAGRMTGLGLGTGACGHGLTRRAPPAGIARVCLAAAGPVPPGAVLLVSRVHVGGVAA